LGVQQKKFEDTVTIRQLTQRKFLQARATGRIRQSQTQPLKRDAKASAQEWQTGQLPTRPDDTVLSDAIPLFFIGRNHNGFWVARDSAGRCGGLFLFRRSAARFARRNGLAGATMLVEHPIELDLPNQGSKLAELMAALTNIVSRRAPRVAKLIGMAIAQLRSLDSQISRALDGHRRNREAIENELFGGEFTLASKNDDDLPISRWAK
jgi:hypothetical protein